MRRMARRVGSAAGVLALTLTTPRLVAQGGSPRTSASLQQACQRLRDVRIPNGTITGAALVTAGPLSIDGASVVMPTGACRVAATLRPSSDSDIKVEIWLPLERW